jgi:hypothetical protein
MWKWGKLTESLNPLEDRFCQKKTKERLQQFLNHLLGRKSKFWDRFQRNYRHVQKPNSWTYNFVEVSGHNLDSAQAWGFHIQCLDYKPVSNHFCSAGGGGGSHNRWWIASRKTLKTFVQITFKNSASVHNHRATKTMIIIVKEFELLILKKKLWFQKIS